MDPNDLDLTCVYGSFRIPFIEAIDLIFLAYIIWSDILTKLFLII